MVMETAASPPAEIHRPALDPKGFSVKKRVGRFAVGRIENPAEGRAGDQHPLGRLLLIKALEIRQPDGFELVQGHGDFFELGEGSSSGLEDVSRGSARDPSAAEGSRHEVLRSSLL
jgi:hypothetical protein